ncbi:MAG: elongation factor G [Myxococcales bacterium]|nr:elongation factor G [Myxococcales bacterium]
MERLKHIRNIGISAHIDSGKTTLSERVLFYTGKIHAIHEVRGKDGVGAKMDSMDLEREKGITIQSAATYCEWKGFEINLIDTPGHVDFTIEVERSLRVLDGAVLVLCSVAGVQSQSMTVTRQMNRYNVPRLAFINKMDRTGADYKRVTKQLHEKLNLNAHVIVMPMGAGDTLNGVIDIVTMEAVTFEGANGETIVRKPIPAAFQDEADELRENLMEALGDIDDHIAELFLDGEEIPLEMIKAAIRKGTTGLTFVPVICGSAYRNQGVQVLLDCVTDYLPSPYEVTNHAFDLDNHDADVTLNNDPNKPLVMLAFKLEDGRYGQLTYVRVYQGVLKKGEFIINARDRKRVKVGRLVRMHSNEMHDIEEAKAGDIVALFGVDCASGDTFTDGGVNWSMTNIHVPNTVIDLSVAPKKKGEETKFSRALNRFTKEDPTFRVRHDEESGDTIISGMGELHLDVYIERIRREFGCEVVVGEPQVAYREAITTAIECDYTHKKQTGGAGQFARIQARMIPITEEDGPDYEFVNQVVGGTIPKEYIPSCDKGFQDQLQEGLLLGKPVIGVKMEVFDGKHHPVDSSDMAFKVCAQTLIREFYHKAHPVVLEPVMKVEVSVPNEFQGSAVGLLNQRRGIIFGTQAEGEWTTVEAHVPLTTMFGFSTELRSATQGKGEFSMEFFKYAQAPKPVQEELIKQAREKKQQGKAA